MDEQADTERQVFQHLLGELPAEEQERIEMLFFHDDLFFEEMNAAEDGLIEQYLRGELSDELHRRFESQFLTVPSRRRKVQFTEALLRYADNAPQNTGAVGALRQLTRHSNSLAQARTRGLQFDRRDL